MEPVWRGIRTIIGDEWLRPSNDADAVDGVRPGMVAEPGCADEVAAVLDRARAAGLAVIPRGGGTKLGWGSPPRAADLVLSTRRMDAVLEHAAGDMTASVQAGCSVARLQETLARSGQRLASDVAWPERATVGGILATNESGSLRVAYGSLRDQLIGITVALPDGRLASSGGRVVKNVAGYDLPKLFTGSLGTLGVVAEATFRLYPLPRESRTLSFSFAARAGACRFVLSVLDSTLAPSGVQLSAGGDAESRVAVRLEGTADAGMRVREERLRTLALVTSGREAAPVGEEEWTARERLWEHAQEAVVCTLTFLPAELAALLSAIDAALDPAAGWRLVAQGVGVGWLRLEGGGEDALAAAVERVRDEARARGGSLIVRGAPPALKPRLDVWGPVGNALPLMQRVKQQFDPGAILNPGRYVGGI